MVVLAGVVALILAAVFVHGVVTGYRDYSANAETRGALTVEYVAPGASAHVRFPTDPAIERGMGAAKDGVEVQRTLATAIDRRVIYSMTSFESELAPGAALDGTLVETMLQSSLAKIGLPAGAFRDSSGPGLIARDVDLVGQRGKHPTAVTLRGIIDIEHRRAYLLSVTFVSSRSVDARVAESFFATFAPG